MTTVQQKGFEGGGKEKKMSEITSDGGFESWFYKCFTTKIKTCWMAISATYNWACHMKMNVAHPLLTNCVIFCGRTIHFAITVISLQSPGCTLRDLPSSLS